jgi:hypothetical protein
LPGPPGFKECLHCDKRFTPSPTGRRQKYSSQKCRQRAGNGSAIPIQRKGQIFDETASQPIDITHPLGKQTRRDKGLHFEEWPKGQKRTDRCITYMLTDGKQVNTGAGRAFAFHSQHVVEVDKDRRWGLSMGRAKAPGPRAPSRRDEIPPPRYGERSAVTFSPCSVYALNYSLSLPPTTAAEIATSERSNTMP